MLATATRPRRKLRVHVRWMIGRDLADVATIDSTAPGAWCREEFMARLRQRHTIGMTAEVRGDIVGAMVYTLSAAVVRLDRLIVAPGMRGRGIGSALLAHLRGKIDTHNAQVEDGRIPYSEDRATFRRRSLTAPVRATWLSSTVRDLCAAPPDAIPAWLLADALEDMDCDDARLLACLRHGGTMSDAAAEMVRAAVNS